MDRSNEPEQKESAAAYEESGLDHLYNEAGYWHVNLGETKIHAKRIPGHFRRLKWMASSLYLLFFFGPYLRWGDRQAILIDIPGRKSYIFGLTFWPQDYWMLSLALLSLAIGLFFATTVFGRVFCGYFCWQTVWVDVFTWIEEKLEGSPKARFALDAAPWTFEKIRIKTVKHLIFLLLCTITGVTFTSYFIDVRELWSYYLTLEGSIYIWRVPLIFMIGSYVGVAIMREQFCFWLCPYARIQGVMIDPQTIMPSYDFNRGEPRARVGKGGDSEENGDCIECSLCIAVCPTGVDIRSGQQEGCITCGLCIDACDTVMEKVHRPTGLISYRSLLDLYGEKTAPWYKRGRIALYGAIMVAASGGILFGMIQMGGVSIMVIHERQPLYVRLSDGSIQNRYELKIVNKSDEELSLKIDISGLAGAQLGQEAPLDVPAGAVKAYTLFVAVHEKDLVPGNSPVHFVATSEDGIQIRYKSAFVVPRE